MVQEKAIGKNKLLVICGTTAVGKSALALELSKMLNIQIVSADSMQIYQSLDIGTAKPSISELKKCKHHMIDNVSPFQNYNVYQYTNDAINAINQIWMDGDLPVVVGGTGLYIESLLNNYKFQDDKKQQLPDCDIRILALTRDRELIYNRINQRVDDTIQNGLVDEVKKLREIGLNNEHQCMQAIGYKEIWDYLEGNISLEQAIYDIKINSRHYAKRQITWFRHMDCEWVDIDKDKSNLIQNLCEYYIEFAKK
ncbi:MAG: tRNA dimethylallyltransferase [Clostridia bacterium]|nr:tRNA dimethylallyltransferase [Clostridia bacterium]